MDKPWGWGPLSPTRQSHHSVGPLSQGASGKCLLSSRRGWEPAGGAVLTGQIPRGAGRPGGALYQST